MRIEQFKYLNSISHYKSMNEASKHLYVTQQNLSSSIKQLENELELKILERSSKGVELTEDGKYINELGKAIVEYVAKIEDYAQHQKNLKKKNIVGRINIAITQYYANTKMPDLISNFCEKNPEVDVDIYVESSLSIVEQLITNKINLGLVNFDDFHLQNEIEKWNKIEKHHLSTDKLIVLANKHSAVGKMKSVSINRLLKENLFFNKNVTGEDDWVLQLFLRKGTPKKVISANGVSFGITQLEKGLSVGPMASQAAKAFINSDNIIVVNIKPTIYIHNLLLIKKDTNLTEAELALVKMIMQHYLD